MTWAIKWREENHLDGKVEYLVGRFCAGLPTVPNHLAGHTTMVFQTRAKARTHIKECYGYIRQRSDLYQEPHGWKMPVPVRVRVEVREIT